MNKNMIEKEKIISSISRELNIVWARWIFLIILAPLYVWLQGRNFNIAFGVIIIFAIIYNFINHVSLNNNKFQKDWFDNNIYFDMLFISLLVAADGGFISSIYICYYVFIVYEGIKREYKYSILLGLGVCAVYSIIAFIIPYDGKNLSIIILRDVFILVCSVFVSDILNQITLYGKQHKKEYNLARRDKVTGLLNKNALDDELNEQLEICEKDKSKSFCIMIFNLDNLKLFNEFFGYPTGDDLLKYFAKIIQETVNSNGKAFRYGGDEFLVLLNDTDLKETYKVAEIIRRKFSSSGIYIKNEESKQKVTVSCGIACYPEHSTGIFEVIEYANKALKEAKTDGKNKVVIAEREG